MLKNVDRQSCAVSSQQVNSRTYLLTKTVEHSYDYKRFMIMMKPNQKLDLSGIRRILIQASHIKPITEIEGVFDPVGKLFVILHKVHFTNSNPKAIPIVYLRVKMAGYIY